MLRNFVLNLENRTQWNHHPNIPGSFRMLIVGASRSGKTALLLSMLIEPDFLDYNNLIIFTTRISISSLWIFKWIHKSNSN